MRLLSLLPAFTYQVYFRLLTSSVGLFGLIAAFAVSFVQPVSLVLPPPRPSDIFLSNSLNRSSDLLPVKWVLLYRYSVWGDCCPNLGGLHPYVPNYCSRFTILLRVVFLWTRLAHANQAVLFGWVTDLSFRSQYRWYISVYIYYNTCFWWKRCFEHLPLKNLSFIDM